MERQELSAALSIALLYVVRMLGLFMVLPVLPMLVDEIQLATPFLIGLALGIYGLSQAVLQIPLGLLSDKFGRKPVIAAGLLVFVLGSFIAAFSNDIYGIIAGRFLQGCGAIASTLLALLSDVTRPENRSKAMAIIGMSIGASFGIALVVGPWVNSLFGISGVFIGTGLAGILGLLVLIFVIPTPLVGKFNPDSGLSTTRVSQVLGNAGLIKTTFGIFALHYLLMSSFVAFPAFMAATGEIATGEHSQFYFWILLATFILMGPFMRLSDRPNRIKSLLLTMIGMFVLSSIILIRESNFYAVIAAMILFFMAFNLLEVILPSMVSKLAPAGARGTAMGIYTSAQFAGAFVGGAIGGYIAGEWPITYLMYVNIGLCLVWIVVGLNLPQLVNNRSMMLSFASLSRLSNNQKLEALASVDGVSDVVLFESDELVYLNVNTDKLDADALDNVVASINAKSTLACASS
ncbi:MAG: MFS transporter [Pseudomonadales bacterium]|nr:MFS transporter [Pseudomonadales bacterium]